MWLRGSSLQGVWMHEGQQPAGGVAEMQQPANGVDL